MQKPSRHIFICTSSRHTGQQKGFCHSRAGVDVLLRFRDEIEARDLGGEVFVNNTGCFGICERGPVVVVYPDNVWYAAVTPEDVPEIVESHVEGGKAVERLAL